MKTENCTVSELDKDIDFKCKHPPVNKHIVNSQIESNLLTAVLSKFINSKPKAKHFKKLKRKHISGNRFLITYKSTDLGVMEILETKINFYPLHNELEK